MSATLQLNDTLAWAQPFVNNRPMAMGAPLQPALMSATIVRTTMLGAPFTWRQNRSVQTFTCTVGNQDYNGPTDMGYIERAQVQDIGATPFKWHVVAPKLVLDQDTTLARPANIAVETEVSSSNVSRYRLMPVPDKLYPMSVTYQRKAQIFTTLVSPGGLWDPLPDEYAHIFNWGFLAMMYLYTNDPRFGVANQKFVALLLGTQQGLSQTQINLWLNNWQAITGMAMALPIDQQQGTQGRGV